jgi:hypothetical protein
MSSGFEMTAMQRSAELSIALLRGQLVQRMLPRLLPPPGAHAATCIAQMHKTAQG